MKGLIEVWHGCVERELDFLVSQGDQWHWLSRERSEGAARDNTSSQGGRG